jgi:hypothetical protein
MSISQLILALGATYLGYLIKDLKIGYGSILFQDSLFIHPNHFGDYYMPNGFDYFKYIPLILFLLFPLIPKWFQNKTFLLISLNHFNIFNQRIIRSSFQLGIFISRYLDKGLIESTIIGPLGLIK